jgi:hypothetical protein
MIYQSLSERLEVLQRLIQDLPEEKYRQPSLMLGSATIGQHVRHVLEVLQCLKDGHAFGVVNYDRRKRDSLIENHPQVAIDLIEDLLASIQMQNKPMIVSFARGDETVDVHSTYFREINYNTEHAVHHMAMIQVALREMKLDLVTDNFGKANSTIRYEQSHSRRST